MKNQFQIVDNVVHIKIPYQGQEFTALIDLEDLPKVQQHTWCIKPKPHGAHYAQTQLRFGTDETGKRIVKKLYLHRFVMDAQPGEDVDHVHANTLDARKSELRKCSHRENCFNRGKRKSATSSKFKGVYWNKQLNKWRSRLFINGKYIELGHFDIEIEAAKSYNIKALELFGSFAKLNILT